MNVILRHLTGLASFRGREAMRPFWIWAVLVIAIQIVAMPMVMMPKLFESFARMERFAAQHPDQVTRTVSPSGYSIQVHGSHPELMPDFNGMLLGVGALALAAIALLAAAVVRRLHDSDRSGFWALPTAVLLLAALAIMGQIIAAVGRNNDFPPSLFVGMMATNLGYLASLGWLVVLLGSRGTPGENRYGPPPL